MLTQADMLQRAKEMSSQVAHINSLRKATSVLVSETVDLSNIDAGQVRNFIQDWCEGTAYKKGQLVRYENEIYRIGQDLVASSVYKPSDEGVTALYSHILLDELGFEIWQEYDGVSGSYAFGQIVYDRDAGEHYTSDLPNNVWGPPSTQPDYWHLTTAEEFEQFDA